jgi:uncharacterized damage-inducible protein DinB
MNISAIQALVSYNDMANRMILRHAAGLSADQLDQPFEMGVGTLRRTLMHTWAGEHMWLQRWLGRGDTPWVAEDEAITVADLERRWQQTISDRDAFLSSVPDADLPRTMTYRDSKGPRYTAALEQMILQGLIHSIHHRAQASNMLRRLGAGPLDLDYMYMCRTPA